MKALRKFIVKNFVLFYQFQLFGKTITSLRAPRIIAPSIFIGLFILSFTTQFYLHLIIFIYLGLLIWIGFSWGGLGYFKLFPVKWHELDFMQKYYWGSLNPNKLTEEEYENWVWIRDYYNHWKKFPNSQIHK
jgi:hypothetical protein